MKVGNIVTPIDPGNGLYSGGGTWGKAVVLCVEPFLLVSPASDMLWSTKKAEDFQTIGVAGAEVINAVQWRLEKENVAHQVRAPYGESLLSLELGCGLTLVELGVNTLAVDLNLHVKTWPSHGNWAKEIGQGNNPSYGWLFEYRPDESLWRALRKLGEEELAARQAQVSQRKVAVTHLSGAESTLVDVPEY